jgi:Zn finger protein HypA/HybF involved in hydrogenase expression
LTDHLYNKAGCPECKKKTLSKSKSLTQTEFIKKAKKAHGDKYDYSKTVYNGSHQFLEIECPEHGPFKQIAHGHILGYGCPKCAGKAPLTTDEFIERARKIHGDKYDYTKVTIKILKRKIKIICPEHGEFTQTADNHLKGSGCPSCSIAGFKSDKPATLYYLFDPQTGLYKIGVTNRSVIERFGKNFCSNRAIAILEQTCFKNGYEALEAEKTILEEFKYARTINESWPEELGGRTEFFRYDILQKMNVKDTDD